MRATDSTSPSTPLLGTDAGIDYLLCIPQVEELLLENLLPFDIARLLVATGWEITPRLRREYMNPVRDVFDKHEEIELLTKAGVNIILLGHRAHLLHQRLNDTKKFIKKYGNGFVIDLIAIAYCHPEPPVNAPGATQFPSARFAVTDRVLENLGSRPDIAYSWLEDSLSMLPCTNTSLAPFATPPTSNIRLEQFKLNLRCCWFNTIDFVLPEEASGIFDWSYDEDVIETSATIIRHDGSRYSFYSTRCSGGWLHQVTNLPKVERGTPALTHHRPNVNMHEVLIRLEIPREKRAGVVRIPTPCWPP
jgi:hypothetical protein